MTSGEDRLTGERPEQGVTPGSLLALHDAGYRAVVDRLGTGRVLDVGCGNGFESVGLAGRGRSVVAVDYSRQAAIAAARLGRGALAVGQMDAEALGLADGTFDWVCSSHLIEHFVAPEGHVAEVARVLGPSGAAFFLTPNAPADFENPYHVNLFGAPDLAALLVRHFAEVWVGGVDAPGRVKADFAARRARARRLLAVDVLGVRHRMPRRWYVGAYARLLPIAYRLVARGASGGATGISAEDWFVTEDVDETTLVLFAVCRRPRRPRAVGPRPESGHGRRQGPRIVAADR